MTARTDDGLAIVDTNVVVYAYDLDDPRKHAIAQELLEQLSNNTGSC
jgi:predicted nucleic acid-binding protein